MMLTMAYLLLIATLLGLAARVAERLFAAAGWPRRAPWLAALVASVALPAMAYLDGAPPSAATPVLSLPPLFDQWPLVAGEHRGRLDAPADAFANSIPAGLSWPAWKVFDQGLVALWIASSVSALFTILLAAWRVHGLAARAPAILIGDQRVLLSDRLGPAVLGFLRPRIVLPLWLAADDTALRAQVMQHEGEHIAARDQLVLLAALLVFAVMPWNPALWWQLRRLRAAIEVDCDSRVLGTGTDAHAYSEALLAVGQRSLRTPLAAAALTEPLSELEARIRIMLEKAIKPGPLGLMFRLAIVTLAVGLAAALNAPQAQQAPQSAPGGNPAQAAAPGAVRPIRLAVADRLMQAQECLDSGDSTCVDEMFNAIAGMPDLNAHETAQLENFRAFAAFDADDVPGAIDSYERILALPQDELPNGLTGQATRNLATLYLQQDRLEEGLETYDRWMTLPFVTPSGSDLYLRATILHMLERHPEGIAEIERAIASTANAPQHWYDLLLSLQWSADDMEGVMATLDVLNERWPNARRTELADAVALSQAELGGIGFGVPDGDYVPIVTVAPAYPPRAAARGLEGYVIVSYTVARDGSTANVEVVESSAAAFEDAAMAAVQKYKYRPRIVDGSPIDVPDVQSRIEFVLPDD